MASPKVLILAKGFPPEAGGLESYSKSIADAYFEKGLDVRVTTAFADKKRISGIEGPYPVQAIQGTNQILLFLGFIWALLCCRLKGRSFDFIHASTWRTALPAICVYPKTPIVITCHGNEILVGGLYKKLMDAVLSRAKLIVCISAYTEKLLLTRGSGEKNRRIICWNGLGFQTKGYPIWDKWEAKSEKVKIFTVCRHEERKNLVAAVEAVGELSTEFEYLIAGKGPMTDSIVKKIEACSGQAKISLIGRVSDEELARLYSESHIFLHPQIALLENGDVEGFGLVVADAMSFACTVLAGANGGTEELLNNGVNAISLKCCDATEIRQRIEELTSDPENMKAIAKNAYKFSAQHFSWGEHVQAILKERNLVQV